VARRHLLSNREDVHHPAITLLDNFHFFILFFDVHDPVTTLLDNIQIIMYVHITYQNTEMTHSTPVTTLLDNIQIIMYVHMTYVKIQTWTRTIGGHWQLEMRVEGALVAKSKGLRVLRDFLRS